MTPRNTKPAFCPIHGPPTKRSVCAACNAAYMRSYLRKRRLSAPAGALWDRARQRARRSGALFALPREGLDIPESCPVLGIKLVVGGPRSPNSPSLDRIDPAKGYVPTNVRVVSDQANRLKGDRGLEEIRALAARGSCRLRQDYQKVASYLEREALLAEVRLRAEAGGKPGREWLEVANFLEHAFRRYKPR